MNYLYFLFLIPTIFSYNVNFPKYNFDNFKESYNHLDKKNIENIEKMFYLKNNRYSPYRKMIYLKYNNATIRSINVTEVLQNLNDEFMKNYNEQIKDENNIKIFQKRYKNMHDADNEDENDFDDFNNNNDNNNSYKKKIPKNGRIDPLGVFRYNNPGMFRQSGSPSPSSNDEFSNDNNFEIIKNSPYSFKDIGGYDKIKSELMQTADILLNYDKYKKFNVRTPKGIIFEGPPGNGKTLMAKGFSGELNISFISVSGSEFSEKYVGVGASRVRDLFKLANNNKPCIIFIDEIDALARKRGNDMVSSNSEKDQTLNQLLINLDGYKNSEGIFVIGATNRIDLLDPALIRPGRIDKNIYIGNPDSETRREIINIHLNGKPISDLISIDYIVEMTGGFSGAQIENLLNEAMLYALRQNREIITLNDLEFIANRIIAGWQATESKYSDDIINRIVIHEMGHAIIGFFSAEHANLVKVTLNLWSPKTPGYTVFENSDENNNIYTKNGLLSHLMVLLGGRVAEEVFYGYSVTTGAKKDLEQAYSLAQNMVLHYGMGNQNIYPDLSDQSKYLIDQEINRLLISAHDNALVILKESKNLIIDCAEILKRTNILKPENIIDLIDNKYPYMWNIYNIRSNYNSIKK
jgi:cell division protease FtsH